MTGATKLSKLSETMVLVRAAAILKMSQLKQVVMETWRQTKDQTQTFFVQRTLRGAGNNVTMHMFSYGAIVKNFCLHSCELITEFSFNNP